MRTHLLNRLTATTAAAAALGLGAAGTAHAAPGQLDPTYGVAGVTTEAQATGAEIVDVATLPDGRSINVSTGASTGGTLDIFVRRLLADGRPDPSFDGDGVARINLGADETPRGVAIQPDGKIVVAGSSVSGSMSDALVVRLKSDGGNGVTNDALDLTFDGDGMATVDTGGNYETVAGLALRPTGEIVVAGTVDPEQGSANLLVFQLKPNGGAGPLNGGLDRSFDTDGVAAVDTGGNSESASTVTLRNDGTIVVGGVVQSTLNTRQMLVAWLKPKGGAGGLNGALDTRFADDGVIGLSTTERETAFDLVPLPDGDLIVVGKTNLGKGGVSDGVAYRLREDGGTGQINGALRKSFGTNGVVKFPTSGTDTLRSGAIDARGRLVLVGSRETDDYDGAVVYRLSATDGKLDPEFGTGGIGTAGLREGAGGYTDALAVAVQPDGRIVTSGYATGGASKWGATARWLSEPDAPQPVVEQPAPGTPEPAGPAPGTGGPTAGGNGPTGGGVTVTPRWAARTLVSLRATKRSGRKLTVRMRNLNQFAVHGTVTITGATRRAVTLPANGRRTFTVLLARSRGEVKLTARLLDPSGRVRMIRSSHR